MAKMTPAPASASKPMAFIADTNAILSQKIRALLADAEAKVGKALVAIAAQSTVKELGARQFVEPERVDEIGPWTTRNINKADEQKFVASFVNKWLPLVQETLRNRQQKAEQAQPTQAAQA